MSRSAEWLQSLYIVAVVHNSAAKKAHNERTIPRRSVDRTVTEGDRIRFILVTQCEQMFKDKAHSHVVMLQSKGCQQHHDLLHTLIESAWQVLHPELNLSLCF